MMSKIKDPAPYSPLLVFGRLTDFLFYVKNNVMIEKYDFRIIIVSQIKIKTLMSWGLIVLMFLSGCGGTDQWNESDRQTINAFLDSLNYVIKAHKISNKIGFGLVSKRDSDQMLSLYKSAYAKSQMTIDSTLKKMNPELPKYYRLYFQEGLRLRIEARETGKVYSEIQGSALLDSWGDWYEKSYIKIPEKLVD